MAEKGEGEGEYHHSHEFAHSLCSCTEDCSQCLFTMFCSCITYGRTEAFLAGHPEDFIKWLAIWVIVGQVIGFAPCLGIWQRMKVREKYEIPEDLVNDVLSAGCCLLCSMVQMQRQVGCNGCDEPQAAVMH
eukprot:NODE_2668_length_657_cov_140.292763_g2198_i0.p1 GENE.NODE_2668_length_657_cov_140.292763_g2198_i0~~NODE_2668_length_657_cov_140.292763_g2198_i0.p1  ORF type:complete len:154 (+),score=47.05 NODE_2668_length_657_cov_140.292763_g2198_i0:71-463(+)